MPRQLLSLAVTVPPGLSAERTVALVTMADRLGVSAVLLQDAPETGALIEVNDPALVTAARARMDAADDTRPLLVAVPISIGRTMSEAVARADLEPRFTGSHPRDVGIFGTFEQAQEQVLALARAGADGLVLDVPLSHDVADVLAQVRALVVGATPELIDTPAGTASNPPPRTVFYGE